MACPGRPRLGNCGSAPLARDRAGFGSAPIGSSPRRSEAGLGAGLSLPVRDAVERRVNRLRPEVIARFISMNSATPEIAKTRLIESWFPFVDVSRLVDADRRGRDPVYGVHKWFARRPPTLVRALLLASHLDASTSSTDFWDKHGTQGDWLNGAVVYDPFMGGGTSLVESARMGAEVAGRDVDPIAVAVVSSELHGLDAEFDMVSSELVAQLREQYGDRFAGTDTEWTPLHWFWLTKPTCTRCGAQDLLYKDLILATSSGRHGSVVRDDGMHVFCPDCLEVHALGLNRVELRCCGRRHRIASGTFSKGKYRCPTCGTAASHEELQTGRSGRVLIAVEETKVGARRRIRAATARDRELAVTDALDAEDLRATYDVPLETDRRDRRPVSAGYSSTRSLFTDRQWAVFTAAFDLVRNGEYSVSLERELTLMLTGALSSNNVLCGYARDWGRLAPLFSVRGFSLPALTVELNPFHTTGGRGTFRSARTRMLERADSRVRRAKSTSDGYTRDFIDLPVRPAAVSVECRSATDASGDAVSNATVCVTDPPYFDYIAYSELSEFFRVWLPRPSLAGAPLLPDGEKPVESFAWGLSEALKVTIEKLRSDVPLVFTYHSSNEDAWRAIGLAFDKARLSVVNLWPVLADPHMGHHAAEGNCEWDVVVVARRANEVEKASTSASGGDLSAQWVVELEQAGFKIGSGDRASFAFSWSMAKTRFAEARKSLETRAPVRSVRPVAEG